MRATAIQTVQTRRAAAAWALGLLFLGQPLPGWGCFGTELRVGFAAGDPGIALAGYAAGFYVEEKTGIPPEFVLLEEDPAAALVAGRVDLVLAPATLPAPEGVPVRDAGRLGDGRALRIWIRADVLDDLRFFTVDRAIGLVPQFYASTAFRAAEGDGAPKQAARRAVLRAD